LKNSEQFLAKDITLPKLAKKFDSNIVYVSKVISHSRQKRSNDYINDLKIDWIINQLRENSKFRTTLTKPWAKKQDSAPHSISQGHFSKNTGISPTFFVQELKSAIAAGNLP
jgi:YesN/AraC family two-component response regulator